MKALFLFTMMTTMILAMPATSATAADFDAKIVNLDGAPIVDEKGKEIDLTVRTICVNALMAPLSPEEQQKPDSGTEKARRGELARVILLKESHVFSSEEITLLKRLVNALYPSPLVVSQTWKALEAK